MTVLKAESINDGPRSSSLPWPVSVAVGGNGQPGRPTACFVGSYLGGICAGLLVGLAATLVRRRIDAP